jgi:hypothetical protein
MHDNHSYHAWEKEKTGPMRQFSPPEKIKGLLNPKGQLG